MWVAAVVAFAAVPKQARAEGVAVGLFVGEPLGLDLLTGLSAEGSLDFVVGVTSFRDGGRDISYGHITYLHRLALAKGRKVSLPIRLGFGGALWGVAESDVQFATRVPFQLALQFQSTPLELYGEIAFVLQLIEKFDTHLDGGIGIRLFL